MIIAHAPAGIILSTWLQRKFEKSNPSYRQLLIGTLGAVAPDFDMIYFYLLDQRQHHHHTYWTHYPVFWLVLAVLSYAWLGNRNKLVYWCFFVNIYLHLLLDSIVGDIWWLAPWLDKPFSLFTVPAVYQPWWLNFILHWSFGLELFLSAWALIVLKNRGEM